MHLSFAAEPPAGSDYRPTIGIPAEARLQKRNGEEDRDYGPLAKHFEHTVEVVSVRHHSNIWTNQAHASNYLAGLLVNHQTSVYTYQVWSQPVGLPDIECTLTFTNGHAGRLLIWESAICFRDQSNRWWFAYSNDYYSKVHPRSQSRLKAPPPETPAQPKKPSPTRTLPGRPLKVEATTAASPPPPIYRLAPINFEN